MCYESWETCFWRRDHKLNWCVGTHTLIWGLPFIKQQTFFQRLWRGSLPAKTWPFWEHKRPHPKRRFSTASWLRNVLLHDDISPTGVCADSDLPFKHQRTLFRGEACLQKRPGEFNSHFCFIFRVIFPYHKGKNLVKTKKAGDPLWRGSLQPSEKARRVHCYQLYFHAESESQNLKFFIQNNNKKVDPLW